MREPDFDMRHRAAEELRKLGGNNYRIAKALGCSCKLVRYWLDEEGMVSPSYLKRIHEQGGDILYIITGERGDA